MTSQIDIATARDVIIGPEIGFRVLKVHITLGFKVALHRVLVQLITSPPVQVGEQMDIFPPQVCYQRFGGHNELVLMY